MASLTSTVEYYNGTSWVDISTAVQSNTLKWSRGIMSSNPTDRVGMPGTVAFDIENVSPYIYSPDSASKATGWDIGTKVRFKGVSGGNTRYWQFRISDLEVLPGSKGQRRVRVTAGDYLNEMSVRKISGLTIQLNKRADELFTTLISQMPFAPAATSYGTGLYIHPYSFAEEQDENTVCMTVAQKIAQSGMCYIYVDGDSTVGETLVLEVPEERYRASSLATFSNDMIDLKARRSRNDIYNYAKTTITPVNVADAVSVIATNDEDIQLEPNETKTVKLRYVDSGTGKRVSGINIVSPVSGTDYTMRDSHMNDVTANLSVTPTDNGNTMTYALQNTSSTVKGTIPKNALQVRGQLVTTNNKQDVTQSDSTSITAYGQSDLSFVLPYTNNQEIAKTIGAEFVRRHKDPHTQFSSMTFNANRSTTFMGYALTLNIGDKITITEAATGITAGTFFINGASYELIGSNILNVTYILERDYTAGNTYFVVGTSALDGAHVLMPL